MTDVKLCGMTRASDVEAAVAAGTGYVGVIFAGGPRCITVAQAVEVLAPARGHVPTVGVFGAASAGEIGAMAAAAGLDIVQLHADPTPEHVEAIRAVFPGPVWAAARIGGSELGRAGELYDIADAVVLDARVEGALGGTGHTLPWAALGADVQRHAGRRAITVLAGGLRPGNVAGAIALLRPEVVDASSGVERETGVKDHDRIRDFIANARSGAASGADIE